MRLRMLLSLVFMGFVSSTLAFSPTLSTAEIQQALDAGKNMISPKHGYVVKDYVLFDVADPMVITPDQGEVEAVIVGTPFERLQYSSYLSHYQGPALTLDAAQQKAQDLANTLHMVVFAHAPGGEGKYQDFLSNFGTATLHFKNQQLASSDMTVFGPARDFYNVQGKKSEFRWLGYVDYTFNLQALLDQGLKLNDLTGSLRFADSTGQEYTYKVDLANYH